MTNKDENKIIYVIAEPSFLRDSNGNYILPRTTTSLVTNSNGKSLETILGEYPTTTEMNNFKERLSLLEKDVNVLGLSVEYIKAIQELTRQIDIANKNGLEAAIIDAEKRYEANLNAGYNVDTFKKSIDTAKELVNLYKENDEEKLPTSIETTNKRIIEAYKCIDVINNENKERDEKLSAKYNRSEFNNFLDNNFNSVKLDVDLLKDDISELNSAKEMLNSSFIAILDLYEFMLEMHPDLQSFDNTRIVEIYKYLFDRGEISKREIPEHIWNTIIDMQNAELVKNFLNR